jgi:hypothetical protein
VRVVEAEVALESGVLRTSIETPHGVCGP